MECLDIQLDRMDQSVTLNLMILTYAMEPFSYLCSITVLKILCGGFNYTLTKSILIYKVYAIIATGWILLHLKVVSRQPKFSKKSVT